MQREWNIYRPLEKDCGHPMVNWYVFRLVEVADCYPNLHFRICRIFCSFAVKKYLPAGYLSPYQNLCLVASTFLPRSIAELHSSVRSNLHLEIDECLCFGESPRHKIRWFDFCFTIPSFEDYHRF